MFKTKSFKTKVTGACVLLSAIILAVSSLTTCISLPGLLSEPIVTLRSVQIANISFQGIDLLCKVNVENRTALDIPVPEFDWELFINTNSFVNGNINAGGIMRSRQTNVIDIPVRLTYVDVFETFKSLKENKNADYRVAIDVKVELPVIGERIWNFTHEGVLPVLQLPKISAPSMKIDNIDFTRVQLAFSVDVENPNNFALPAPELLYDFFVNRSEYNSGISVSAAPLAAGAVTAVVVAISLNYADLFRTIASLAALGEAPGLVSLKGGFGIPAFADENIFQEISGSIPLLRVPTITFGGFRVKDSNITRIDFELSWVIENRNTFAMNVNELSYNFTLNNRQLSNGRVPGTPQIGANSTRTITLDFSLNNLTAVTEFIRILTGGTSTSYAMSGNVNLGAAIAGIPDFQTPFNFSGNSRITR